MKKLLLPIAVTAFLLTGCDFYDTIHEEDDIKFDIETITYAIDRRTNFCYAIKYWNISSPGLGFIKVPCTEEVLNLIEKQEKNT